MTTGTGTLTYGFERTLERTGFENAIARVTASLQAEGFGVLTDIDVAATFKQKLGVDFRRYRILGACNPSLAHRALQEEPQIGLLLPCNVVVQELGEDRVSVSIVDPKAMFTMVENPAVAPVAAEVDQRLRRVMASIA